MRINQTLPLLLFFTILATQISCVWYEKREIEKEGNILISKIESFRKTNGRLPNTLTEAGDSLDLEGPFAYGRKSSTRYTLTAAFDGGKLYEYDSETKKWGEIPK